MSIGQHRRGAAGRGASVRVAAWAAFAACLLQLLAPLAWAAGDARQDALASALIICTPDGFRVLDATGGDTAEDGAAPGDQRGHRPLCPDCTIAAHAVLPPQQEAAPLVLSVGAGLDHPEQERAGGRRPLRLNPVRAPPLA